MCISNRTHSSLIQFAAYTSCIVNKHCSLWCENLDHGHDRYYNRTRRPMASLFSLWAHVRRGNCFYYLSVKVIVLNNIFDTRCIIAFGWMPHNITDGKSTLAQVIVWCRQVYVILCNEWEPDMLLWHIISEYRACLLLFLHIYIDIYVFVCVWWHILQSRWHAYICVLTPLSSQNIQMLLTRPQLPYPHPWRPRWANLSMSLNSFWAIHFICELTTISTC